MIVRKLLYIVLFDYHNLKPIYYCCKTNYTQRNNKWIKQNWIKHIAHDGFACSGASATLNDKPMTAKTHFELLLFQNCCNSCLNWIISSLNICMSWTCHILLRVIWSLVSHISNQRIGVFLFYFFLLFGFFISLLQIYIQQQYNNKKQKKNA